MNNEILNLFKDLKRLNANLYLAEGALKLDIQKELLTQEISNSIKSNKKEIINFLSSKNDQGFLQIPKLPIADGYALSAGQRRLWVLSKFEGGSEAYNMANYVKLSGKYDIKVLERSIYSVVERHEILRTVFKEDSDGQACQNVLMMDNLGFEVAHKDYRKNSNPSGEALEYIKQDLLKPFDLIHGPLIRVVLLRLTDTDYLLYYNMHHIISDGWSLEVLARDIIAYYNHYSSGISLSVPNLRIQYKDYCAWQREQLKLEIYEVHRQYWLEKMSGELPAFDLGTGKSRPALRTYNGWHIFISVNKNELEDVRAYCKEKGGTLYMFLVALLRILFYRYTGDGDLLIGSPVAGREHPELENQIGIYVNTIVLRSEVDGNMSFNNIYKDICNDMLEAYEHQIYPFDKLISELNLSGDASRNALFDVMAVMQNTGNEEALKLENSSINESIKSGQVYQTGMAGAKCDLEFNFQEVNDQLNIGLTFNTDIYENSQMQRLLEHFYGLLSAVLENSAKEISMMDYISERECKILLEKFNGTEVAYSKSYTLLSLYYTQLTANLNEVAIIYEGQEIIYSQVEELSNQLSNYLKDQYQVGAGNLVGIRLNRSEWISISILSILKLEAAYIPIGMDYPMERVHYIREESRYRVCIDLELIEDFRKNRNLYSKRNIETIIDPKSIAYGIYTSGSTGMPKGVLNTHSGLINRLLWMRDYLGIVPKDTILQKTPYTFDVSVWEFLLPSITGCRMVIARPEGHKDPHYLQELIAEQNVSIIHFVPSMLRIFLENLKTESCKSLRHLVCSGEALPSILVEMIKEKLPWVRIHNLYGPTEAAIDVTAIDLTEIDTQQKGVSIGKPISNTSIYIVDSNMALRPLEIAGELLIGGVQVAQGYLNQPQLTKESFISNPYRKGELAYKTGDLARWLHNGELEYIGRLDNQVKLRGNRIELGEIESQLMSSGLIENVVVSVQVENDHQTLIGYIIPKPVYKEEDLYTYLRSQLPEYMLPAQIVKMESFPLTSSGKINRKKLPIGRAIKNESKHYEEPIRPQEIQIAEIWKEVLSLDKIDINLNFFRIGGDSILAIKILSKVNSLFKLRLTVGQLYQNNTIKLQSELVSHLLDNASLEKDTMRSLVVNEINLLKEKVIRLHGEPESVEDVYPMSDIQKGMVMLSNLHQGAGVYHDQFIFQIPLVDKDSFKKAFAELVFKHETLRTYFDLTTFDTPVQIVKKKVDFNIDYQDIKSLGRKEKKAYVNEYMLSERKNPFDTNSDLLWRITIFELSNTSCLFLFQFHHAILDGWSVASLNTELFQVYRKIEQGIPLKTDKLKTTYREAIIEELYDKKNKTHKEFWIKELENFKKVDLYSNQICHEVIKKEFNSDFKNSLENTCKENGVSLKTVLYGTMVYVLGLLNHDDDFIIGLVTNNRPVVADGDKLLGCFLNTIPSRNKLTNTFTLSWYEYFKTTNAHLTKVLEHDRLTLYEIINTIGENIEAEEGSPFFNTKFSYIDFHIYDEIELHNDNRFDKSQEEEIYINSFNLTDTAFDILVNGSGNTFAILYELKRRFKYDITIDKIHALVARVLENYVEAPHSKLQEFEYLTDKEKALLLKNGTSSVSPKVVYNSIIDAFENQVMKRPNGAAVAYEAHQLTYKQVDEQSNQVARYLQKMYAIAPNDFVGIMLPPSHWSIIAILGILKAGATYVPIDPETPAKRVQYLIEDTKLKTLITLNENQEKAKECISSIFIIDNTQDILRDMDMGHTLNRPCQEDLAYVIFTSGSTGEPKGVMITHENVLDYTYGLFENTQITSCQSFALMSNIATDLGNTVIYGALLSGGLLYLPQKETLRNAERIHEYFNTYAIDCIKIVPTHWKALAKANDLLLPKRMIIFGGDILPATYVEAIKNQNSNVSILNHYGPTETTIGKLLIKIDKKALYKNIPIGHPFSDTSIYVVNKQLNLCPMGIPGELLIGGKGVGKGYLNKYELTQSKFIQNPFTEKDEKVYRTGDSVRMLPDGGIEFIGRIDNQVKVRGNRVELGDIETVLSSKEEIDVAVVLFKESVSGEKDLIAYYTCVKTVETSDLRSYLQDHLPSYMVPNYFVHLKQFPLTQNGKINRKALPNPEKLSKGLIEDFQTPSNEKEKALVEVWQSVLNRKNIGIKQSFFELGGDSIKAILVISRLKKKGYNINVGDILKNPTISQLATIITLATQRSDQSSVSGEVLLSPIQKRFLYSINYANKNHYNQSVLLESKSIIDLSLLHKCIQKLIEHHDALRMSFKLEGAQWHQRNSGPDRKGYELASYDLSESPDALTEMTQLCDATQASIDLERGPLVKVVLFYLKNECRILIVIHHLVVDGVSWRILLEDLENIYEYLSKGEPVILPDKTDSFQKWTNILKDFASSDIVQDEYSYWKKIINSNVPLLPEQLQSNSGLDLGNNRSLDFFLDESHVALLQNKVHLAYNTNINDILLCCLGIAVRNTFRQNKVIVNMESHGRENLTKEVDVTRTVGWFTSIYPLVLEVSNDTTDILTSLIKVKELLRKVPRNGVGYGILKYLRNAFEKELKSSIVFNYLGDLGSSANNSSSESQTKLKLSTAYRGLEIAPENNRFGNRLQVSGLMIDDKLHISVSFNDSVFQESKILSFLENYKASLELVISKLSTDSVSKLTSSDLTYKELSMSDLSDLNRDGSVEDVYKMSPLQEGLYYHWISDKDKSTYVSQRSFQLHMPNYSISNIRKAFESLVHRHAILRTGFRVIDGVLLQIVHKKVSLPFDYKDVSHLDSEESQKDYSLNFKSNDKENGFSEKQNSLIRLSILDYGKGVLEFIWSFHHILMDGWCNSILINEFYQILMSLESSNILTLPGVAPYSEYIKWIERIDKVSSRSFWRERLSNYTEKATLPFKKENIIVSRYNVKKEQIVITAQQLQRLRKLCSEHHITENTLIQSTWGLLLSKYSNRTDVVFGAVVSGRPSEIEGIESMVGLFINTIPTRLSYDAEMTIADLLKKQQEAYVASLDYHYLSLSEIQSESILRKDLLDHIYVFENYALSSLGEDFNKNVEGENGVKIISQQSQINTHYDFDILVIPKDDIIEINLQYNSNVYEEKWVEQIRIHLEHVLGVFLKDTHIYLKDICCFPESEEKIILSDFNKTNVSYPEHKTILDLFEEQVKKHPNEIAIVFEDVKFTYQQIDLLSNQLAHYLCDKYEIEIEELVGIELNRSEWMLIGILAILKCGAAYVPIDPDYPAERKKYIYNECKFKVCIDDELISGFKEEKEKFTSQALHRKINKIHKAYGIYTSGSTGNPKGVLNTHGGLYNRLMWMWEYLGVSSKDVVIQKTPVTFDVSVWELLLPAISGCSLVFARPEGHKDPKYLQQLIAEQNVSIIHFVPSMLGVFLEELEAEKCESLRHVVCSGEALPSPMVEEFKRKLPWVRIHNLYGPTEASIDVTAIDLTNVDTKKKGVSIGKPVANTKIYIVDKFMGLQPIMVPGELVIEGIQVALGYLHRPELTNEKFVTSPFNSGERLYRTGDLAKWLPNGEIAYLGRIDNQVKIRGNRIELGEIEARIGFSGYVTNAVVQVRETASGRKHLTGFVIPKEGYTEEKLLNYLRSYLPDYMVPNNIIDLEEFPLSPNGKIDRNALSNIEANQNLLDQYVAPRNEIESSMASIWKQVLEIDLTGVKDDFFRIGGDSILSIRLISKINKHFNVNLSIAHLYQFTTIETLCSLIEQEQQNEAALEQSIRTKSNIKNDIESLKQGILTEIDNPQDIEDIYPMRDIQKGMVMLSSIQPGLGVYHDQFIYQIPTVNKELFGKAYLILMQKHAALRTLFDMTRYQTPVQIVKKDADFTVDYKDIKNLDRQEVEGYVKQYMLSERKRPFKVDSDLLWRVSLFEVSNSHSLLLFQFHHAILDGWSVASLNTELSQVYNKLKYNDSVSTDKLEATEKDALVEELFTKQNEDLIDFWRTELEEYKRLNIFEDNREHRVLDYTYSNEFKNSLAEACNKDGIPLRTAIYGAFVYALNIINYENDFVIGMVTNTRPSIEDGDKLLGCFLNTIPVRNKIEDELGFSISEYFQGIEKNLSRIRKKGGLTLYEISRAFGESYVEDSPFFDVMYNYTDFHIYNDLIFDSNINKGINLTEEELNLRSFELTNIALELTVNTFGNSLGLRYKLTKVLKNNVSLEQMHRYVDKILSTYVEDSQLLMKEIDYLTNKEKIILSDFNKTNVSYPEHKTILDLFEEQVKKHPNEIAIVFEDVKFTYQQIDLLSNQLAHYLCDKYEIEIEELVGIELNRSEWMLIGILAILKCGAAYVPIDPDYPAERKKYIYNECKFKVCIDDELISGFKEEKEKFTSQALHRKINKIHKAYGIYTSGSTGNPKGVLNTHGGLYNRLMWMWEYLGVSSKDVVIQKTPVTFDVSVWELLLPAISGCSLVFARPEGHKDPKYLQQLIAEQNVSIIHFVPSMLGVFLEELEAEKCESLRHVVCSGEALPSPMVEEFKRKLPWVRIHNLYGPTEASIDVTAIDLTNVDTKKKGVSIGKPVANTKIYIVDKFMGLQPIMVPGELVIEGIQVALGYLHRPELTNEKFVTSPFNSGERLYRTGDLAKWLPNGEIAYLGRIDNQVKIRGNRIELGEIEARIGFSGYVTNAVVQVRETASGRKHLTGFVIPKEGYTEEKLLNYLRSYLPDYMVPNNIIDLEEFPLSPNGKINKNVLADLNHDSNLIEQVITPRNHEEEAIAKIWRRLLEFKGESVGVNQNFFRIGGDSLLVVKLKYELEREFQQSLTIVDLFNHTSIEQQARLFSTKNGIEEKSEIVELKF